MKIACLGWGSLIWKPDNLPIQKLWFRDGPILPIEFTRHSSRNRITLVLTPGVDPIRSLWALMLVTDPTRAKMELATREGIQQENIEKCIGYWRRGEQSGEYADVIRDWALCIGLDAVVWTALRPRFQDQVNKVPTVEEVILFLRNLQQRGESEEAEEYIRKAPRQVDTQYRRRIEADLNWTPR